MKYLSYEIEKKIELSRSDYSWYIKNIGKKLNNIAIKPLWFRGHDIFWQTDTIVLRYRIMGKGKHQLTIKGRTDALSTLIRTEYEIELNSTLKENYRFIKNLCSGPTGKKLFSFYKEGIIWDYGNFIITFYEVKCKYVPNKFFYEIEAKKGLSVDYSKKIIKQNDLFPCRNAENMSLFEIYYNFWNNRKTKKV